jgi:PAS domain S-box-containing protein
MTVPPDGGLALDLVRRLLEQRTADDAAKVLVGWLEEQDGHPWTVLAVESPTTCRVVTGADAGREVPTPAEGTEVATDLGTWGHLVTTEGAPPLAGAAAAALAATVGALQQDAELHDRIDRLEEAQAVAHMGSYDWDIATDVNRWSDELYRIYGHEPQSFNASYERFQSMVHPDDRERVQAMHQEAYATGEPYHTVERIVRPDGEVRVLDTTGRVIRDAAGTPVRMAGVCIDITDRWRDQQEATRAANRFRTLVETAPDAIVVVQRDGRVAGVNRRAAELFAADEAVLLDGPVADLLPDGLPVPGAEEPVAERRDVTARRADGTSFRADVTVGVAEDEDEEHLLVAFVRDATARLDEEDQRERRRSAEMRRRQALEINDNVLQGLAATRYALEVGDVEAATEVTDATLSAARHMVADLLADLEEGIFPGSLVRAEPAPSAGGGPTADVAWPEPGIPTHAVGQDVRVVLVDDAEDLRLVFRIALESAGGFEVVGEAGDGEQALAVCREHRPDLVLLDLSMPVMDGLEVLPILREDLPDTVVVVLSGLGAAEAEHRVLDLGAVAYLEKGLPQAVIVERLRAVTGAAAIS